MELTHEEKITINNFSAHLSSLKSEINVVNLKLSEALEKEVLVSAAVEKMTAELADLEERIKVQNKRGQESVQFYRNEVRLAKESIRNRVKEVSEREEEMDRREIAFEARRQRAEQDIQERNELIESLDKTIALSKGLLIDLASEKQSIQKDIIKASSELEGLKSDIAIQQRECEKTAASIRKEIASQTKELLTLEKKVAKETEKITAPKLALAEMEDSLKTKEKNLLILINRFRRHFKSLYPDQEPPI